MMTLRNLGILTGLGLMLLSMGCATLPTHAEIPLGEWSGQGLFVATGPPSGGEEGEARPYVSHHGEYPTQLKIERVAAADKSRVRLEILSQRGEFEHMEGDRTHLVALLERGKSLGDDTIVLYRLVKYGVSFDEQPPRLQKGPKGPSHASCLLADGDIILRIHYLEGFSDTFRFHGERVYKDGLYAGDEGGGLIHWSEWLRR
ncbi:MAG: hypothetical protein KAY37_00570 [Phycisphaerae bacterium]|nr:hypothetical protein [Phycisphaerae bacterium]